MKYVGVLALLCVFWCSSPALAVNYVHDEVLWTKQRWSEFMLDFPWAKFKSRDAEYSRLAPQLNEFAGHTLNGPHSNIQALVEDDLKRGPKLHQTTFEVSLLDDQAQQGAAADVAQCKVCLALSTALWESLVAWVNVHQKLPTKAFLQQYVADLCEFEAVNEVLQAWVILRARVEQGRGAPFAREGASQEFYLLSQRTKQHATPQEIAAARLACHNVVRDHRAAEEGSDVVQLAHGLLRRYLGRLLVRLGRDEAHDDVPVVEDGPSVERSCYNKHPQCEYWARVGECTSNPGYMTGAGDPGKGWCRLACGECTPPKPPALPYDEEAASFMRGVSADLLAVLHSKGCVSSAACQWAAGEAKSNSGGLLGKASGDAAALIQQAAFITGPIRVAPVGGSGGAAQTVDEKALASSKVMLMRAVGEAVVPADKGDRVRELRPLVRPTGLESEAARVLWEQLTNKCLYVTTGWWSYEVCPWHHINQFHMAEGNKIDWVISLGLHDAGASGASDWTLRNSHAAVLYTQGSRTPYVSQLYRLGNICELDEPLPATEVAMRGASGADGATSVQTIYADDVVPSPEAEATGAAGAPGKAAGSTAKRQVSGAAGGAAAAATVTAIRRKSELRLMCSPDSEAHVVVRELQQCIYRVELYVPELCQVPGFAVLPPVADGDGGAGAAGSEDEDTGVGLEGSVMVVALPDALDEDTDSQVGPGSTGGDAVEGDELEEEEQLPESVEQIAQRDEL